MKLPLVLTAIILFVGSFWGIYENRVLTVLRARHLEITREAAMLGIPADLSQALPQTKATKRQREDSSRKAKDFADTLVTFAKEMKAMEEKGESPDAAMQKRILDMVDGMLSFKGAELKIVIDELRGRADLDDQMRKDMIGFSIMMLAQQHPQTALAIFTESSDLLKDNPMSEHVLSSAISQWAKDQPLEALEWIKKNAEKHPDLVTEDAKRAVVTGAAETDYGLAFQLSSELKLTTADDSILWTLARSAHTPERRAEFLAALRKQSASMADKEEAAKLMKSGVGTLFSTIASDGFDKAMDWMKTADLTPVESSTLEEGLGRLSYHSTKADTGKWLDWMAANPSTAKTPEAAEVSESSTRNLVREWTENDYKAAGEWLASTPAGPHKETATLAYLETVAPYDPEVAVQWAETLGAEQKTKAIQKIHKALKKKDPKAAEDFASQHGLSDEDE